MSFAKVFFLICLSFHLHEAYLAQSTSTIQLNTDRIDVEKFEDYWEVRFLCTSHVGACYFEFTLLPEGWMIIGQKIRVPISDIQKIRSYLVEATIREPAGDSIQKEIVLHVQYGDIQIEARNKPLYSSSTENGEEPPIQQSQSSSDFQPKNQEDLSWLELNGIVPYVPTLERLDSIIESGDVLQIVRIIQNIVSDKSACSDKSDYLMEVADRIGEHISENQEKLRNGQAALTNAEAQFERLIDQKNRLETQVKTNDEENEAIRELKEKEEELERNARETLSKHYTFTIVANKYLSRFNAALESSTVDPEELEALEEEISQDEEEIQDLDQQIDELLEKRRLLEFRVKDNKKKVQDTRILGNITPEKITELQNNYKEFSEKALEFKQKSDEFQYELQMVRSELSEYERQAEQIRSQLEQTEQQIKDIIEIDEGDIADLKFVVDVLERNAPYIEKQIEQCTQQLDAVQVTPIIVYPTRNIKVVDDLEEVEIPPVSQFSRYFPILEDFSLFSEDYVIDYGSPKLESFSCQVSDFTSHGIVTDIEEEMMRVRSVDGKIYGLVFGLCTQLKARRPSYVPKIGDFIDWEGEQVSPVVTNVHIARMFVYP